MHLKLKAHVGKFYWGQFMKLFPLSPTPESLELLRRPSSRSLSWSLTDSSSTVLQATYGDYVHSSSVQMLVDDSDFMDLGVTGSLGLVKPAYAEPRWVPVSHLRVTAEEPYVPPVHGPMLKKGWWYVSRHQHRIMRIVARRGDVLCVSPGKHARQLYRGRVFRDEAGHETATLVRCNAGNPACRGKRCCSFDIDTIAAVPFYDEPLPQPQDRSHEQRMKERDPLDWESWWTLGKVPGT